MADIFGIGTSGLLSYQRAMTTISHNIANANTQGYSRQRTQLTTLNPQGFGYGFVGAGVGVSTIERVYDQFIVDQLRTQTSTSSSLNSYYDLASRIDNLLSDSEAGISPTLQEFFNAVQAVSDSPGSTPARQVLLTSAESVVERMQYMYDSVNSLNKAMISNVTTTVDEVNALASSIADINQQIVLESRSFGQPPNDLMDQRDEMIRQLAERVSVSTNIQEDGAMNVFVGKGQSLVIGGTANNFVVAKNQYDPQEITIELTSGGGTTGADVTKLISGGKLGGLFQLKDEILDPALNQLGRVAVGLASSFNAQHIQGLTLNDVLGGNFFTDFMATDNVTVLYSDSNSAGGSSTTAVTSTITDISQLTAKDYQLRYLGGDNFDLYSLPDNTLVDSFNAPMGNTYTTADGFSVTINNALTAGDTFQIRPTRTASNDLGVLVNDVSDIAAAGSVRAFDSASNRGDALITPGERITNTADPNYVTDAVFNTVGSFTVVFSASVPANEPTVDQYEIYDSGGGLVSGPTAYVPGVDTTIGYSGMQFTISRTPLSGDTFTLERNVGAVSDNRNALELAALQTKNTLINKGAGATVDFQDAYGQLVSMVGTRTHQADVAGTAQQSMLEQATARRESVSGVNLDEEAANLLRYQQAYQATAQVVSTARSLFNSLLDALG
jgi:flagellar hook-associated protein 1